MVSIQHLFFDVGGRALLATRLLVRIRQTWHIEVPLRDFFAAPTIAHRAVLITEQQAVQTAPDVLAGGLAEVEGTPSEDV